jgi:hypothetical protein
VLELRPVRSSTVALRLAAGVAAGAAVSVVLLILLVGARPDLDLMLQSERFWSKAGYLIATAGVSLYAAARLARPASGSKVTWLLCVPFVAFVPVVVAELARTDPSQWGGLLLGYGWQLCTWVVLILSLPIYLGLWWAFRSFAPTRTEAAGAVTGLSASAIAGVVYCLHCPTDTAVFAFVWYSLAFGLAAIAGRMLGPRLLHW